MDMYKYAAQNALRFPSVRGELVVEQLFHLPLSAENDFCLDNIAKGINRELKDMGEESFVEDTSNNPQKKRLEVALEIVKDVIATKLAEKNAYNAKVQKDAKRKKILDALAKKEDQKFDTATAEDLEKELAALEA